MQVILKKDVQNLGEAGDIVNVKDGYARNFLLPQSVAEIATKGALENREKNLARRKSKNSVNLNFQLKLVNLVNYSVQLLLKN